MDPVKCVNDTGWLVALADRPAPKQAGDTSVSVQYIKMLCIEERDDVFHYSPLHTFTESDRKMGDPILHESVNQRPIAPGTYRNIKHSAIQKFCQSEKVDLSAS